MISERELIARAVVYQSPHLVAGVKPFFMVPRQEDAEYFADSGGVPETSLVTWAETLLPKGQFFVDVGAHVGTWCIPFACAGHPVIAFEAQSWLARLCNAGFALNGHASQCRGGAISDRFGFVALTAPHEDGGGGSIVRKFDRSVIASSVYCETLDSALSTEQKIGLIKIDVEGAELDVLRGAAKTISIHRPKIIFECWEEERGQRKEQLFEHLSSIGYKTVRTTWNETWIADPE
jgi:FkbM family methyltransferase